MNRLKILCRRPENCDIVVIVGVCAATALAGAFAAPNGGGGENAQIRPTIAERLQAAPTPASGGDRQNAEICTRFAEQPQLQGER